MLSNFFFQDEDAYHFIGYMAIDGRVYELDGLREGPIDHGEVTTHEDWLDAVRPVIMERINALVSFMLNISTILCCKSLVP